MPPIFKALTTISAWVLFIVGLLGLVMGLIIVPAATPLPLGGTAPPIQMYLTIGLGIVSLILAVCAMKLRQMLE